MNAGEMAAIFRTAASAGGNKLLTLTFLRKDGNILLGMKKRGLGQEKLLCYYNL